MGNLVDWRVLEIKINSSIVHIKRKHYNLMKGNGISLFLLDLSHIFVMHRYGLCLQGMTVLPGDWWQIFLAIVICLFSEHLLHIIKTYHFANSFPSQDHWFNKILMILWSIHIKCYDFTDSNSDITALNDRDDCAHTIDASRRIPTHRTVELFNYFGWSKLINTWYDFMLRRDGFCNLRESKTNNVWVSSFYALPNLSALKINTTEKVGYFRL